MLLDVEILLENRLFNLPFERLALSESSSTVNLLLHADWMMLKNASNQGEANERGAALPFNTIS